MKDIQVKRNTIKSIEDLLSGAGTNIVRNDVFVDLFKTELVFDGVAKQKMEYIESKIGITIGFEAGYSLTSVYQYNSEAIDGGLDTHEKIVNYINNGHFDFRVSTDEDAEDVFDNWTINVQDDEHLLSEITAIDSRNSGVERVLGEPFEFNGVADRFYVSQRLYEYLAPSHIDEDGRREPYNKLLIAEIHAKARNAMVDYLQCFA